jgi:PIF1 helicase.
MRLGSTAEEKEFAEWLIGVGHGQHTEPDSSIKLPQHMKCGDTVDALINSSYPHIDIINNGDNNDQYFLERTILTSRNDDVTDLNHRILQKLPGQELLFQSADSVITEEGADGDFQYPLEYLNSIEMGGLPLAKLRLKIGSPIMILRNLDPSQGLCNGT